MALCWAALAALYCLLLLAVFCMPLDPIEDGKLIRARFHGFFRVPFAALYRGSEFNALTEVLKKLLFFAPLGALLSMVAAALAPQGGTRRLVWLGLGVLIAVGMGTGIEMVQVFLPPHVPDVTDVLLYSSGAVLGMWLVQRLLKST
jgi:glycopeptide antibiotics resistance protein